MVALRRQLLAACHQAFDAGRIRLLMRHGAKVKTGHAVWKARHALDLVDADELSAQHAAREHCGAPAKARARQGGGQASQSTANDDDVVFTTHRSKLAQIGPSRQPAGGFHCSGWKPDSLMMSR